MCTYLVTAKDLFDKLNEQEIKYCHWKSNRSLDQALSGFTDLDLLVDRGHRQRFKAILCQLRCKSVISSPGRQYPAIEDYLGYDESTGKLFHLHVHYQLILGERFVKNYRVPLEQKFLNSAKIKNGIKVVAPEWEIIVLTIRALLKYRDRDVIKDVLSIRSPGLPRNILQELEYLLQHTTVERVETVLEEEVSFVSPDIVLEFLRTVTRNPRSGYKFYQLRRDLRRALTSFQRYSRWQATARYFSALLRRLVPINPPAKKTLSSGGMLIALVGADGAGKSTVVNELRRWLSWKLDAQICYMGSGERLSAMSRVIRFGSGIFSRLHKASSLVLGDKNWLTRSLSQAYRLTRYLRHLSIARTRHHRYIVSRRKAGQGSIIICDRYPLEAIHRVMHGTRPPMDGPRIAWMHRGEEITGLAAFLSKKEQEIYRKISPPDYLVLLRVSLDTSLQRKPDHSRIEIEPKTLAIEHMDRRGLRIIDVDANQSFEKTLLQIKGSLWNVL